MEYFKVGDVVKLKSENIEMVIEAKLERERFTCTWLDNKQEQKIGAFNASSLEKVNNK